MAPATGAAGAPAAGVPNTGAPVAAPATNPDAPVTPRETPESGSGLSGGVEVPPPAQPETTEKPAEAKPAEAAKPAEGEKPAEAKPADEKKPE